MKNKELMNLLPIKTKRLIVRKTTIDDVDLLLKMDKQEVTQRFLGGIKNKSREERIEFLKRKDRSLTVSLLDGTKIGITGLSIDESTNTASIGYIFDYDYCNNGYCTEICKRLIDIAFNILDLDSIHADTVDGNISSIRVLEKLGFTYQNYFIKNKTKFLNYIIKNNR